MKLLSKLGKELIKKSPMLIVCAMIVGVSYWLLFNHYRSFSFVGGNDFIYTLESKLLDARMVMRGKVEPTGKVGILAIDEKAIQQFGRWPFSRKYYEKAFDNLKKLGVKWIGFDSIYSEPEKTYLEDALPVLESGAEQAAKPTSFGTNREQLQQLLAESPGDVSFANGIKNFENIVLGYFYFNSERETKQNLGDAERYPQLETMLSSEIQVVDMPEGSKLDNYGRLIKGYGIVSNIPRLTESTPYFAYFSNDADDDAINRWVVLVANVNGHLMPSLALKTIAEYLNREIVLIFDNIGVETIMLVNRDNEKDVIEIPVDPLGGGRILVNHRGPGQTFHHYSLADAYNNSFTADEKKKLKGSVLLLGATAIGTNDMRPNPFDPAIDGVENHAAVMDNVIRKDFLKRPISIFATELMIVLGIGLLFAPLMIWGRAMFSGIAVVLFLVGYYYVDKYLWFQKGVWAYMAVPSIQIVAMFISTTLIKYMTEEREKKKVKGAFQYYLSPDVINQVLEDPDSLSLGGEKKELTVFFSDVRGFTTISESLSPEKLCELMNEYFTPMTAIILRSKGVLDKYIGDAIMAFWGAPLAIENQADVAATSAIEMLFALDQLKIQFKQKGFPEIDMGIGLNTGPMSVGNMGSMERFTYTVMGDSVNLGARLEGLTKEYGIKVMISEFTQRRLTANKFFTRDLDDIRVKGKNEPVKVFDLMRPDFLPNAGLIREFIGHFEEGRKYYKEQNWEMAHKAFLTCLQMKPQDKTAAMYVERVSAYKAESPGQTWDGVYNFTHK